MRISKLLWLNSLFPSFYQPFNSLPPSSSPHSSVPLSPPVPSLEVRRIALWKPVAFHLHWETLSGRKTHTAFYPGFSQLSVWHQLIHPHPPLLSSSSLHSYTQLYNANLCTEVRIKLYKLNQNIFLILRRSYSFYVLTLFVLLSLVLAETPSVTSPIYSLLLNFTPIFHFFFLSLDIELELTLPSGRHNQVGWFYWIPRRWR